MQEMGLDVEALQDNGILIDTESDESKEVDQQEESSCLLKATRAINTYYTPLSLFVKR